MAKFLYSRVHHKPNDKHAYFAIGFVVVIVIFSAAYLYNFMTFSARDRIVREYMKGIEQKDATILDNIVATEYESSNEISKDISELGGTKFITRSDYHANKKNGLVVDTTLYGFKNYRFVKKNISLIGMNEAWYLVLGDLKEEYRK